MGCDIHLYSEVKVQFKTKAEDGSSIPPFWECCDYFKLNPYRKLYKDENKWDHVSIYGDRNYSLFAALADVRNDEDIIPIDKPRGIPEDASKAVKKAVKAWGEDGHSHSWFTAKELFDYQKTCKPYKHHGYISPKQAEALDKDGIIPNIWCGYTSDNTWVYREWFADEKCPINSLIDAVKKKMMEVFDIYDFLENEEKAKSILKHEEDFRIVFWFDN